MSTSVAGTTEHTVAVVTRFEGNFAPLDVDALMADMTDDCVFEHVTPPGQGFGRHEGAEAVRAVWASMPEHFPGLRIDVHEIFADGNKAACRYTMRWRGEDGGEVAMRGADIITLRDGKIAEKLTYATA